MVTRFELAGAYAYADVVGYNPDIDTATVPEDIWAAGGLYPWPAAAAATTVVSSSANDTAAGTGARTVTLTGLNAAGLVISETVTLNGVTPVAFPTQYLRIIEATAVTVGSGGVNEGTIDIKHGATVLASMLPNYGVTKLGVYTIPSNYQEAMLLSYYFTLQGGTTDMQVVIQSRRGVGYSWQTIEVVELESNGSSVFHHEFDTPPILATGSDLRATVLRVGTNNSSVSVGMEIALKVG